MDIQPYLYFDGRCEEAINFYKQAIGAQDVCLMRFSESPDPSMTPPGSENKVMHACFRVGDSTIMASDGNCKGHAKFEGVSLTITTETVEDAERLFAALSDGGQVQMPMAQTFFSQRFGMVADRFRVSWMVLVKQ